MKCLFGLILSLFLASAVITAQPPAANEDDEFGCGLRTELVVAKVWVTSSKKGFLKDLTDKNFEVYDEKTLRKIDFFNFDEETNQYIIAFYNEDYLDDKWHEVKVEVKLSADKKKEYGEVTVSVTDGYYPGLLNQK